MKSTNTLNTNVEFFRPSTGGRPSVTRLILMLAIVAVLAVSGSSARAQLINLLNNPDAETGNFSGWTTYNNVGYNFNNGNAVTATQAAPHGGTYSFWMFGDYNTGGNAFSGFFQFAPAHPGEVFNADGWVYQIPTDSFSSAGDGNNFFFEVTFQDSGGATLARYRSAAVTNGSPTGVWNDLFITNQYDPNTFAFIGTVTNLVAPANTVRAEFNAVFDLVNNGGGSVYLDDLELLAQTPPPCYVTNIVPSNVILATNQALTFSVVGPGGPITNIQMTVTTISGLVNGVTNTVTYNTATSTNWATFTGLNSSLVTVSFPLATNMIYSISFTASDINLNSATGRSTFDTLQPVVVFEAEDFNFSGGLWVTNVPADGGAFLYLGVEGIEGIDEHDSNPGNPSAVYHYRDNSPNKVSTQGAFEVAAAGGAITRQKYINYYLANPGANNNPDTVDEEVGFNNAGDWVNYTRIFPPGNYNVYARLATDGTGAQAYFETVTGDPTQPNQSVVTNGTFSMTDNNWNVYQYVPLLDNFGNLVSVPLGGTNTVRVQVAPGGNPNENFYMIMPAVPAQNPVLQGIYPDGQHPFEPTNHFAFTVGQGSGSAIPAGSIHLALNGSDVTPQVTFTSTSSNWTGSISILSNAIYSAVITVTNSTHLSSTYTVNFDTFSESLYSWEAEDFDFNSGTGFIDNPIPSGDSTISGANATGSLEANSYYGFPGGNNANAGVPGVDFSYVNASGMQEQYRIETVGTQVAGDYLRQKFLAAQTTLNDTNIADFNIGWYNGGDWLNYTRDYPAGTYRVYGRMAGGAGAFSGTTLCLVTNGWGTSVQSSNVLGSFADPNAAGWQTWHWVPMLDTNGNFATVTFDGSTNTLKLVSGNNLNVNFLMLVPAPAPPSAVALTTHVTGTQISISFATQASHSYTVLYTSSLKSPAAWSTLTTITGDGTTKTVTDTMNNSVRFYRVAAQ